MRLPARRLAPLMLLLWSASLPAGERQSNVTTRHVENLRTSVLMVTGPNPTDCGQHLLGGGAPVAGAPELQKSLACSLEAAKSKKPSWTVKQYQGIDSLVFEGLLGTSDGVVQKFYYDSDPCGGPGCTPRFEVMRCDKPFVTVTGQRARFECGR